MGIVLDPLTSYSRIHRHLCFRSEGASTEVSKGAPLWRPASYYGAGEEERLRRSCSKRHTVVGCLLFALFIVISVLVISLYGVYDFQLKEREVMLIKQKEVELKAILAAEGIKKTHKRVEAELKEDFESGRRVLSNIDAIRRENSDPLPTRSYFGTPSAPGESHTCDGGNDGQCVGRFGKGMTDFFMISSRYKTLACLVQKNMSTLLQAIMCYLKNRNEDRFRSAGYNLSFVGQTIAIASESDSRGLCEIKDIHGSIKNALLSMRLPSEIEEWMPDSWNFLAIIREPVDRFLSGFLDKCIRQPIKMKNATTPNPTPCNGCRANLTCFILTEYERLKKFELRARELTEDFEVLKSEATNEDFHFFPQNWRCNFEKLLPRYTLLKYTAPMISEQKAGQDHSQPTLSLQLMNFLEKTGVNQASIDYLRNHVENDRTVHLTHDSKARRFLERRLRSSPYLMEYIVRMFYHDFHLFGFEPPSVHF